MSKNDMKNSAFSVDLDDLLNDLKSTADTQNTVGEANGEHRSNIKSILDTRGYHKKAFADFRAMFAMSDSKFADYWRTFKPMLDAYESEAERRIGDLVDKMDAETSEMEGDMA